MYVMLKYYKTLIKCCAAFLCGVNSKSFNFKKIIFLLFNIFHGVTTKNSHFEIDHKSFDNKKAKYWSRIKYITC